VGLNTELRLDIVIDTDHRTFRERQRTLIGDDPLRLEVGLVLLNKTQYDLGKLELLLEPVAEPHRYHGYVALDLGNTASTLVGLPAQSHRVEDIDVLNAEAVPGRLYEKSQPNPLPVETRLRIDGID